MGDKKVSDLLSMVLTALFLRQNKRLLPVLLSFTNFYVSRMASQHRQNPEQKD